MPSQTPRIASVRPRSRKSLWVGLQVVLTLATFGYLLSKTDVGSLRETLRDTSLWRIPLALLTLFCVLLLAAWRWRLLLGAYGAQTRPPLLRLFRLQVIGLFYNMMPGAVGGDVVRGIVTRNAFGGRNLSAGLAVVLIERVLGLLGLLLLLCTVLWLHPIAKLHLPPSALVLLGLAGLGALVAIAASRRLADLLPKKLAMLALSLPELCSLGQLAGALAISVVTQMLIGVVGHEFIAPLSPQVSLLDSLVLSPLSFATIFFPLTVAGAGTRDAAMVALYGLLGVPRAHALSASLQILLCYICIASVGGLLSLLSPLDAGIRQPDDVSN